MYILRPPQCDVFKNLIVSYEWELIGWWTKNFFSKIALLIKFKHLWHLMVFLSFFFFSRKGKLLLELGCCVLLGINLLFILPTLELCLYTHTSELFLLIFSSDSPSHRIGKAPAWSITPISLISQLVLVVVYRSFSVLESKILWASNKGFLLC